MVFTDLVCHTSDEINLLFYLLNCKKCESCVQEYNEYDKDTEYNLATFGCKSSIGLGIVADKMQFLMHISHVGMLKNIEPILCDFFEKLKNRNVTNVDVYVIGNESGMNDKTLCNILDIINKNDFKINLVKKNQLSIILSNDSNIVKEFIMTNTNQNEIYAKYPSPNEIIYRSFTNDALNVCNYRIMSSKIIIIDYSKDHISLNSLGYDKIYNLNKLNDDSGTNSI
jgi:hypothetical protein